MAFLARLGALTDELVEVITAGPGKIEQDRFNACREIALRKLRQHHFLRTNPFEVDSRLAGLVERFRVQHRESLADALDERLEALAGQPSKWHPELLHLLLELSDQPTQNSRLEDLELLRVPEKEALSPLKWEDIAREDGWNREPGLWRSIDYSDSSDEEGYGDNHSSSSAVSDSSFSPESSLTRQPGDLIVAADHLTAFRQVQESQAWRQATPEANSDGRVRRVSVREFHVVREVLLMLHGLPTSLFDAEQHLASKYQLSGVSWDSHRAVVTSFAESGRILRTLRTFAKLPQSSVLLQVFRDWVEQTLRTFDRELSTIESRFVSNYEDVVISLISLEAELRPTLRPLTVLSGIVGHLIDHPNTGPFKHLELLFDEVCVAQLGGDSLTFNLLARAFLDCFQVYLRPIRQWMENGQLIPGDRIFFVSESSTQVPLSQIWHSQYRLRRSPNGDLHAPRFLQPSAGRIFTAGKSIVVLNHLGKYEPFGAWRNRREPGLDFETVCSPDSVDLAPFSELFHSSFEKWIQSKHQKTASALKRSLFDSCGLWSTLDAFDALYLMSDGSVADLFADELSRKLDSMNPKWHDRYALSGIAQEAFISKIDASRVSVLVSPEGRRCSLLDARNSVKTAIPEVSLAYRTAWPAQLVISGESIAQYQAVCTLQLQLRRAVHVLIHNRYFPTSSLTHERDVETDLYYALRAKLLWFSNAFGTYLTTLVLAPSSSKMREDIEKADDVDAMINVHLAFMKRVTDESCLGSKLRPIHEGILDILDLALKLQRAHSLKAERESEEMQELSRLSLHSSPLKVYSKRSALGTEKKTGDGESGEMLSTTKEHDMQELVSDRKPYTQVLRDVQSDFDRHLRFIVGGLRGVARATSDPASAKWEMLAEMLDVGIKGER